MNEAALRRAFAASLAGAAAVTALTGLAARLQLSVPSLGFDGESYGGLVTVHGLLGLLGLALPAAFLVAPAPPRPPAVLLHAAGVVLLGAALFAGAPETGPGLPLPLALETPRVTLLAALGGLALSLSVFASALPLARSRPLGDPWRSFAQVAAVAAAILALDLALLAVERLAAPGLLGPRLHDAAGDLATGALTVGASLASAALLAEVLGARDLSPRALRGLALLAFAAGPLSLLSPLRFPAFVSFLASLVLAWRRRAGALTPADLLAAGGVGLLAAFAALDLLLVVAPWREGTWLETAHVHVLLAGALGASLLSALHRRHATPATPGSLAAAALVLGGAAVTALAESGLGLLGAPTLAATHPRAHDLLHHAAAFGQVLLLGGFVLSISPLLPRRRVPAPSGP